MSFRINSNYSNFYSGRNSFSNNLYSSFGEYSSIRSGNYKKLAKAIYADDSKKSNKTNTFLSSIKDDKKKEVNGLVQDADALKNSVGKLATKGKDSLFKKKEIEVTDSKTGEKSKVFDYDKDAIASAVKSFVKDYNDYLDTAASSDNTKVLRNTVRMVNQVKAYSMSLENVGIKKGADNKLTLDEEKLKSADITKVKNLFKGSNSFVDQIGQKAELARKEAVKSQTTKLYGNQGGYNPYNFNSFDSFI